MDKSKLKELALAIRKISLNEAATWIELSGAESIAKTYAVVGIRELPYNSAGINALLAEIERLSAPAADVGGLTDNRIREIVSDYYDDGCFHHEDIGLARAIEREVLATRPSVDLSGLTRYGLIGSLMNPMSHGAYFRVEDVQALLATKAAPSSDNCETCGQPPGVQCAFCRAISEPIAVPDLVTLDSARLAIDYVDRFNGPGRRQEAIESLVPYDATKAAQPASGQDGYGDTDFGFTFAGVTLEEGDKRLAAMLIKALGTDHPAMDDFVSLVFRARATRPVPPVPAPAEQHIPTEAQVQADEAKLYRELTGDVTALGFQGLADAVAYIARQKQATPELAVPNIYAPSFDQAEFDAMVEIGTKAWAGVPEDFLEDLRRSSPAPQPTTSVPRVASIDTEEFWTLLRAWAAAGEEASDAQINAIIAHIDAHIARQAQAGAVAEGWKQAAAFIEKQAQDYINEYAESEHDTGAVVWRYGDAGHDYYNSLVELAEELRMAAPTLASAPQADEPKLTVRDGMLWPEGYCRDPDGKIIPPAGKHADFKFGYDIGYADGLVAHRDSVAAIENRVREQLASAHAAPFGYFHELLNAEGKGTGVWLGCPKRAVTEKAYTEGETGKEIVALYASTQAAPADDGGAV